MSLIKMEKENLIIIQKFPLFLGLFILKSYGELIILKTDFFNSKTIFYTKIKASYSLIEFYYLQEKFDMTKTALMIEKCIMSIKMIQQNSYFNYFFINFFHFLMIVINAISLMYSYSIQTLNLSIKQNSVLGKAKKALLD